MRICSIKYPSGRGLTTDHFASQESKRASQMRKLKWDCLRYPLSRRAKAKAKKVKTVKTPLPKADTKTMSQVRKGEEKLLTSSIPDLSKFAVLFVETRSRVRKNPT